MHPAALSQTDLPGTRPLYADLLRDFASVSRFYPHAPSLESASEAARDIRLDPQRRQALVDELSRQNRDGSPAALENLDRLSAPETVVVATGQQVGLLGGPAFTLYKALTAVRCADELTRRGTPAVPVFWLATEDHDLAEVNHCWLFGKSGEPRRVEAVTSGASDAAVGAIQIEDAQLDTLDTLFAGMSFGSEASALAHSAYGRRCGFGQGFRALYQKLLTDTGIVFLCPMEAGIRALAAPLVRSAIKKSPELTDALLRRGTALLAAGYHQQVHFQANTSLVLLFENEARVALKRKNGAYWTKARSYSRDELLGRLEASPLDISPSALLRPVMQDYLMPTAALVAGPSEASYLAQASVLYEELLGRMPAVLPRASFTVLDAASDKLLQNYGLSWTDCLVPRRELESAIAAAVVPRPLQGTVQSSREEVGASLERIESALREFDPTLAASFKLSRNKIDYQLTKMQSKVSREALRRAETAQRHAARLSNALCPNDNLQERAYGVLPFLAQFGPSFVERVSAAIRPGSADHRLLQV